MSCYCANKSCGTCNPGESVELAPNEKRLIDEKIDQVVAALKDKGLVKTKGAVPSLTGHPEVDKFLDECLETMRVKGHDYRQGNDEDLLHNFRTVADTVGVDMEKVWFTYFYKHYSAMATFIKEGGQQESEPIEGRIKDQIVYLLLFYVMVQERKLKGWKKVSEIYKRAEASDRNFRRLKKLHEANEKIGVEVGAKLASGPVDIDEGKIKVDVNRLRKLAGIDGVFVDPDVLSRAGHINKVLMERDRGMRTSWDGQKFFDMSQRQSDTGTPAFDSLSKEAQRLILADAMLTAKPMPEEDFFASYGELKKETREFDAKVEDTGDNGLDGEGQGWPHENDHQ